MNKFISERLRHAKIALQSGNPTQLLLREFLAMLSEEDLVELEDNIAVFETHGNMSPALSELMDFPVETVAW